MLIFPLDWTATLVLFAAGEFERSGGRAERREAGVETGARTVRQVHRLVVLGLRLDPRATGEQSHTETCTHTHTHTHTQTCTQTHAETCTHTH